MPSDKICVPYDSLYRTVATNGVIGYGDVTHGKTCGKYIPNQKKETCENLKTYVSWGDFVEWSNSQCVVKTGYCYDGEEVMEQGVFDAKYTRDTTSGSGGGSAFDVNNELICNGMFGVWDNGKCKCGSEIMTHYSQQCENGQIVKQKITSQALKTTNFKLQNSVFSLGNNK